MYKCTECSQQFTFAESLRVHKERHHSVASESTSSLLADDDATGFTGSSGNLFDLPPTTPPTT